MILSGGIRNPPLDRIEFELVRDGSRMRFRIYRDGKLDPSGAYLVVPEYLRSALDSGSKHWGPWLADVAFERERSKVVGLFVFGVVATWVLHALEWFSV